MLRMICIHNTIPIFFDLYIKEKQSIYNVYFSLKFTFYALILQKLEILSKYKKSIIQRTINAKEKILYIIYICLKYWAFKYIKKIKL
jgi:uncharacterized membrane protein